MRLAGSNRIRDTSFWIQGAAARRWYDRRTVVLVALLVGLAASLLAAVVVAVRGVGLWRQTKRTGAAFARELSSFEERTARIESHLAEWERSSTDLDRALERLRVSRARLRVLQDALDQAQGRVRWLRAFLPTR
jgi:exonuclease VII small subunit